ncbi:MAG: hypothetical protein CM15mP120_16990 [Pseudomonadota bacterium]|nr:MAG: hypothetical protein CM15mP120_16990 [Pseudomonadota bacterium]
MAILGRGAYRVLKETTHILLEGVPKGIDLQAIKRGLTDKVDGVVQIHHVHALGFNRRKTAADFACAGAGRYRGANRS